MNAKTGLKLAMIALALGAAGCKKKPKDEPAPQQGSADKGSAGMGSGSGSAEAPKPAPLAGKELAAKYLACNEHLSAGKLDDFKKDCITAQFLGHPVDDVEHKGADAVMAEFAKMRAAFSDMKSLPQLVFVNGRTILAIGMMTGTHDGPMKTPMGDIEPTKKKISTLFFHKLIIDDENKATEEWWFGDPATLVGQLGKLPKGTPFRPPTEKGFEGAPIVIVAADDAKEKANLEAITKFNEAFNAHKPEDEIAVFTDDAIESDQASPTDTKGKKAIAPGLEVFHTAFPDGKIAVDVAAVGDYVIQHGNFTGTHKGPLDKIKPTNAKVTMGFAEVFEMKDGKIAKLWRFRNGLALATQLGLMKEPPAEKPKP
jgi:predicted ester cyclase